MSKHFMSITMLVWALGFSIGYILGRWAAS
jgi:hypothetical protein